MRINIPPVTRALLASTCALSILYAAARWGPALKKDVSPPTTKPLVPFLALVPSLCLWNPWTFVTSTFVEQNVMTLMINLVAVYFGGKYLERSWGSRDFGLVVLVTTLIPNILMVPTYMLWGLVTLDANRTSTPITGAITLQALFLVAFKQLVPEHTVSIYRGVVKMRVKHFPAIFLLANTLSGLIIGTDTAMFLSWYGLVTTWTYLRFFKTQPDVSAASTGGSALKGDASETFAFATFFPNAMQPPVAAVCNQIYRLLCTARILRPFSDEAIASGNEQAAARGAGGLPSLNEQGRGAKGISKRDEADRRRALALAALDQRLNAPSSEPSVNPAPDPATNVNPQHTEA